MNVRSIKNKSAEFLDYVTSCKADLFALIETWLGKNDDAHRADITPTGYWSAVSDDGRVFWSCVLMNNKAIIYLPSVTPKAWLSRLRIENLDLTPTHAFVPICHAW